MKSSTHSIASLYQNFQSPFLLFVCSFLLNHVQDLSCFCLIRANFEHFASKFDSLWLIDLLHPYIIKMNIEKKQENNRTRLNYITNSFDSDDCKSFLSVIFS